MAFGPFQLGNGTPSKRRLANTQVPAVVLTWKRKLYYDAVVLALGGLTSAIYHGVYADLFLTVCKFPTILMTEFSFWS